MCGKQADLIKVRNDLKTKFKIKFSDISPKTFDYLGMHVERKGDCFELTQPKMISKITSNVETTSEMPYDANLFQLDINAVKLDDKMIKSFRSQTMELHYLSRTRKDIATSLSFLSTRMHEPTQQDMDKLMKVKSYINGTKNLPLRIMPNDLDIRAMADASYGIYPDGKSNTGIIVTVGHPNAPIIMKSCKQKSIANSSTVAELLAFSLALEEVIWLKNLLNELDVLQGSVPIEQDNTSTMKLIEKGPSSGGRTKWLNIKYFWVKEFLENGEIRLEYVPSDEMLADGLTKVLGKKDFKKWRARILNLKDMHM
jgi:hypothetical protein